jgi:hypothetical protein
MDSANKPEKVPGESREESIDLSAGFVPKNAPAAGEPAPEELTPDSFMAQHGNDVDLSATEPEKFVFVPEETVVPDGNEAGSIDGLRRVTRSDLGNLSLGAGHDDHPAHSQKPCDPTGSLRPWCP